MVSESVLNALLGRRLAPLRSLHFVCSCGFDRVMSFRHPADPVTVVCVSCGEIHEDVQLVMIRQKVVTLI